MSCLKSPQHSTNQALEAILRNPTHPLENPPRSRCSPMHQRRPAIGRNQDALPGQLNLESRCTALSAPSLSIKASFENWGSFFSRGLRIVKATGQTRVNPSLGKIKINSLDITREMAFMVQLRSGCQVTSRKVGGWSRILIRRHGCNSPSR